MMPIRSIFAAMALLVTPLAHAEYFVDVGVTAANVASRINGAAAVDDSASSLHVGAGARRTVNDRSDIGVRIELDNLSSNLFLGLRALDYRRHATDKLSVGFFAGAARLDLATPAYGWYLGAGIEIREIAADWSLGLDLRFGDKVARDNLLPDEPRDGSPDNFHDVTALSVYLSRRF